MQDSESCKIIWFIEGQASDCEPTDSPIIFLVGGEKQVRILLN